jgi:hypothetical protein
MQYVRQQWKRHEAAFNILSSLATEALRNRAEVARVREFVAFCYKQFGTSEHFDFWPIEPERLGSWAEEVVMFDLLDHGTDFQTLMVGKNLIPILGGRDWSGSRLSEVQSPYSCTRIRVTLEGC